MSKNSRSFERPQSTALFHRLLEPRRSIHVVAGPGQVGKSTLVTQVTARLDTPVRYASADYRVFWWRDVAHEVDVVIQAGRRLIAIEVKSGVVSRAHRGLSAFSERFAVDRALLIGGDGIALEEFLMQPMSHWIAT